MDNQRAHSGERRITCLTGTPGTGKTTISEVLNGRGHPVIEVEKFARTRGVYSYIENGEALVIDVDELADSLGRYARGLRELVVVGHLSHHLREAGSVVVLRTRPSVLEARLRGKGWPSSKVAENVEAEALDLILVEAVGMHGDKVSEIDTTELSVDEAVDLFLGAHLRGERYPPKPKNWLLEHILKDSRGSQAR